MFAHCYRVVAVVTPLPVLFFLFWVGGWGGGPLLHNTETTILAAQQELLFQATLLVLKATRSTRTACSAPISFKPRQYNNDSNNSGHLYSTVSHRQGWAHLTLQHQQRCIPQNVKYNNYIVIIQSVPPTSLPSITLGWLGSKLPKHTYVHTEKR